MALRKPVEVVQGRQTQDGAGVNLTRVFGGRNLERFDPFLMLDEFGSDKADDYLAGFPSHPHRGMVTVSYMLQGRFEHRDHLGNRGEISDGGVQWMTAGRGVIHSEMPLQTDGKVRGFQLWLNLAAKDKLQPASYQNIEPDALAHYATEHLNITAIAGSGQINGMQITANTEVPQTNPRYWDIQSTSQRIQQLKIPLDGDDTVLLYVVDGATDSGEAGQLLRYSSEGDLEFELRPGSRVLLLTGKPLREPIVQYGPFVMNSHEEIEQAIRDYQNGTLTD